MVYVRCFAFFSWFDPHANEPTLHCHSLHLIFSYVISSASSSSSSSSTGSTTSASSTSSHPVSTASSSSAESTVVFVTATDTNDGLHYVTKVSTILSSPTAASEDSTNAAANNAVASNSKLSTGGIIGIAVAGGVIALSLLGFFIWKCRSRRNGYGDDEFDGIRWPELNQHGEGSNMGLPLPAKPTGGHGIETRSAIDRDSFEEDNYGYPDSNYQVSHTANSMTTLTTHAPPLQFYADEDEPMPVSSLYGGGEQTTRQMMQQQQYQHQMPLGESGIDHFSDHSHETTLSRNRSLGGTTAFEVNQSPEMTEMTSIMAPTFAQDNPRRVIN